MNDGNDREVLKENLLQRASQLSAQTLLDTYNLEDMAGVGLCQVWQFFRSQAKVETWTPRIIFEKLQRWQFADISHLT